jgi:hypothetical protein
MRYEQIGDLSLESGRTLRAVQIAFESVGELAPNKENVVLALHGYTSGPDMILPTGEATEGSWCELIGPGRAIDTDRYFVICPNAIGSSYGSTGAASLDPDSGKPYGASFPLITMRDVVNSQYALLETGQAIISNRISIGRADLYLALDDETRRLLEIRAVDLADYQNMRYARRFVAIVAAFAAAERAALPHEGGRLTRLVIRYLYKLMAYKDEYETARLLTDSLFVERVRALFPGYREMAFAGP